jgi:hypothetical protein
MTTKLLESVFQKASALPPALQDDLARQWLAELDDEQRWDEKFQRTAETIDSLAEEALREHQQQKTVAKGMDDL